MENLLKVFFPAKCLFCYREGSVFCRNCLEHCELLENNFYVIKSPLRSGITLKVFSCFKYDGVVRNCIKRSKYGARQFSALKILSATGVTFAYNLGLRYQDFSAIPIPLSKGKQRIRGFNQADVIAECVSKKFSLKTEKSLLIRAKDTNVQYGQNRNDRFQNLKHAFRTDPKQVRNRKFLLVDDICTSGATLLEAAYTLKTNGAKEVQALTLSRKTPNPEYVYKKAKIS
jgi:competence protein ComFC